MKAVFSAATTAAMILATASLAQESGQTSGAESSQVPEISAEEREIMMLDEIIRDFILNNPEVIIESLTRYEAQQRQAEEEQKRQALVASLDALQNDPDSPVVGNPEGDVTIVEFFDYRCPYCKRVAPLLEEILAEDPNVRVVLKEWPILSEESRYAARAALAANMQGKYWGFHMALMTLQGQLDEASVLQAAERLGIDVERMKSDMESEQVEAELQQVYQLAQRIGATGTPAFVIGDQFYGGAIPITSMRQAIELAREKQG